MFAKSRIRDSTTDLPTEDVIEYRVSLTHRWSLKLPFRPRVRLYVFCRAISQCLAGTRRRLLRKSWLIVSPDTILAQRRSIVLPDRRFTESLTNTSVPKEPPRKTVATNRRLPCPAQSFARMYVKDTDARQECDRCPETDKNLPGVQ